MYARCDVPLGGLLVLPLFVYQAFTVWGFAVVGRMADRRLLRGAACMFLQFRVGRKRRGSEAS